MASAIDITKPVATTPTTQSVRDNFSAAKTEIEFLQGVPKIAKFVITGATFPITALSPAGRWYPEGNITVLGVYFSIGVEAPGTCTAMLKKNGANFLSTNMVCSAAAYKSDRLVPASPTAISSDYFTIVFWSTIGGGSDATICIEYKQTS